MQGYTKLFSTIITSSIWSADDRTRILWVTMLALADKYGNVQASVPGLAAMARLGVEDCEAALRTLSGPDPYSRSTEFEGRRIQVIEGGWHLLNYGKYRKMRRSAERTEYLRIKQREHRERQRQAEHAGAACQHPVNTSTSINHCQPEAWYMAEGIYKETTSPSSEHPFRLAKLLCDLIVARKPDLKRPDLRRWAVNIDRMIRLDGRTPERIEAVIRWTQTDTIPRGAGRFCWADVILSATKLREQFDQLELKMQETSDGNRTTARHDRDYAGQASAVGITIDAGGE